MTRASGIVRVRQFVRADPEAVFAAWTDPVHLRQWFCPPWATVRSAEVDLRVGGRYRVCIDREGVLHTATGTYQEIRRPDRLVFTWDWEEEDDQMGPTLVTVVLERRGDGTEVTLTHEQLPVARVRRHEQAWAGCLAHLQIHLASGDRPIPLPER